MVRPRSCRVIYYFDTPALGRRHQSFGRVTNFPNGKQTQESLESDFPETTFRKTNTAKGKTLS